MSEFNDPAHERWELDLPAYVLDALDPDEVSEMQAHLDTCKRCRAQVRWLTPVVDAMPASVEQIDPPRALKQNLMKIVRSEAAEAELPRRARGRLEGFRVGVLRIRPLTAGIAATVLLAAALGFALHSDIGSSTTSAVAAFGTTSTNATGTLVRDGDSGILRVADMPALRHGQVYEAWVQRGNEVEPASVFVLRRDGSGVAAIPSHLAGADAVLVTSEPAGGSERPTSTPFLRASLK